MEKSNERSQHQPLQSLSQPMQSQSQSQSQPQQQPAIPPRKEKSPQHTTSRHIEMEKSSEKSQQPPSASHSPQSQTQSSTSRRKDIDKSPQLPPQSQSTHPHPQPQPSSHSSSRRTSSSTGNARETLPLPTPPPDPRGSENIFKYPPSKREELPVVYHRLLEYPEREEEFYRTLNKIISQDCQLLRMELPSNELGAGGGHDTGNGGGETGGDVGTTEDASGGSEQHRCTSCQHLRDECAQFIDPLQNRLGASISAALATYGAIEQLSSLYSIWDKYIDHEKEWRQRKQCLKYCDYLNEKMDSVKDGTIETTTAINTDTEGELEQSLALLDQILATGTNASTKRSALKQQRERSKSVMVDDYSRDRDIKFSNTTPHPHHHLLRRLSTYSEGKSKVSKWTKVKAAFKWERAANVPTLITDKDLSNGVGLTPVNNEVARYLRVPSAPCGGSSADSILSSSSGHLLSETGTPGTISSASSMDDIDSSCRNTMRRDSTKSDSRCDSRITEDAESMTFEHFKLDTAAGDGGEQRLVKSDSVKSAPPPSKSSSIKSMRRSKVVSDFEVLPENVIADIKSSTPNRKTKPPPSPLNLNIKQELNDLDYFYSPHLLKSPKDGTQSLNRSKKINSPGNSSVPSSPSRHSEFFAEFESEDLSSGDFSEPSTPNHLSSHKSFQEKQREINQRYQMLRAKLDEEFEMKRREWEKMKTNLNTCRALALITPPKSEDQYSPNQVFNTKLSAKLLEENLTPDFKKKLRKWRVKKQIPLAGSQSQQISPITLNKDAVAAEPKAKIDWNLWKTGQLKLEGQGLSPLPDQKDLPQDFQKKIEQWNKIKRGGSVVGGNDSMKRSTKHTDTVKKSSDDDRNVMEKEKRAEKPHKPQLAKLKAIVAADHPAKQIQVKTSAGVMKFEGISRKFTRKLYEWEKARGIGPESSTFALLHPGYCPIDVGRIKSKEIHNNENSPTLSRSLSLDSIAPNIQCLPGISQQASSLSLNDVNDLKEMESINSSDPLAGNEFKKYEEPEAVMVEVEDHIVETASPLVATHSMVEQQTPIYKYEEVACNDYCNTKRTQSFESYTNLAPLLSALKHTDEVFAQLKKSSPDIADNKEVRHCESTLKYIRNIYPYYTENIMKPNVLNAILDVQGELGRITELSHKSPLDEACCQEIMEERNSEYNEEFKGLHESLELLQQNLHGGASRYPRDIVPDINITSEDTLDSPVLALDDTSAANKDQFSATTLEATDELSCSQLENDTEIPNTTYRNFSNGGGGNGTTSGGAGSGNINKKRLRLRKMGSRQNSKTESDSTTDDDAHNAVLETPRRWKRKNFRLKQRSLDDEHRRSEELSANKNVEEVMHVFQMKPGHSYEKCENIATNAERINADKSDSQITVIPMDHNERLRFQQIYTQESTTDKTVNADFNQNKNVFVKTKRKVFTTVEEPNAIDGIAVVEQCMENVQQGENVLEPCLQIVQQQHSLQPQQDTRQLNAAAAAPEKMEIVIPSSRAIVAKPAKSKPKFRPKLFTRKSLSLHDIREIDTEDERKCHSVESVKQASTQEKGIRLPLASDSFKVLNKIFSTLTRGTHKLSGSISESDTQKRKEHRYKKNPDISKPYIPNRAVVKKIETKISKTNSSSSVDNSAQPDRTDNTLPRICRKSHERKSLTPTTSKLVLVFDYPTSNNSSEPTTPLFSGEQLEEDKPHTPLSERAIRLQKAKEAFLKGTIPRSKPSYKRRDDIVRNETWEQYRRSDHSLSSINTINTTSDDSNLSKSLSVGTITADTPLQSDTGTDLDGSLYETLPRSVSRSAKISSKLGFATLASKFRRVKGGGKKGKESNSGNSALSALCRQTLLADVIAVPQYIGGSGGPGGTSNEKPCESVIKSQSSPHATRSSGSIVRREIDRLNKSLSEQYVKRPKESFV